MKYYISIFLCLVTFLCVHSQEWEKYKSQDLAFIAYFPGTPERTVQKLDTALGELDMHMVSYGSEGMSMDNAYYGIIRSDYPEEQFANLSKEEIKSVLDGAVNGAVTNVNGTLIADETINLNGYPGRKIRIKVEGGILFMNTYLVKNTMYVTQVISEDGKEYPDKTNKFMNAFDILNVKQ